MKTGEMWRVVPSLPDYMACTDGRIMRVPFTGEMPHGSKRWYGGEPHWGVWNKADGRFIVIHKGKTYKVARLICEAFNGAEPFEGAVVMHIDENAANNRSSNLQWGTQKENLNAPGFIEYCKSRTGENNPFIKGTKRQARGHSEERQQ